MSYVLSPPYLSYHYCYSLPVSASYLSDISPTLQANLLDHFQSFYMLLGIIPFSAGHVDAGKSTLMGHLLYLLGNVNKRTMHKYEQESKKAGKASFAYAWVLDETGEERDR